MAGGLYVSNVFSFISYVMKQQDGFSISLNETIIDRYVVMVDYHDSQDRVFYFHTVCGAGEMTFLSDHRRWEKLLK